MNRKLVFIVAGSILVLGIVGCATIMHGTSQSIGFSSTPSGAKVTVDNQERGHTPATASLSRKDDHIVKIEMDGYQAFDATITRSVSGWVLGNILFGGLIGLAVDAICGGLYKLTPDQVAGTMTERELGLFDEHTSLYIAVVLAPDPAWERLGTIQPVLGQ